VSFPENTVVEIPGWSILIEAQDNEERVALGTILSTKLYSNWESKITIPIRPLHPPMDPSAISRKNTNLSKIVSIKT